MQSAEFNEPAASEWQNIQRVQRLKNKICFLRQSTVFAESSRNCLQKTERLPDSFTCQIAVFFALPQEINLEGKTSRRYKIWRQKEIHSRKLEVIFARKSCFLGAVPTQMQPQIRVTAKTFLAQENFRLKKIFFKKVVRSRVKLDRGQQQKAISFHNFC